MVADRANTIIIPRSDLTEAELDVLDAIASARGCTVGDLIRMIAADYLDDVDSQALDDLFLAHESPYQGPPH